MKTIYSLKEFHAKAVEVSGKESSEVCVQVEYGVNDRLTFSCYASGYTFYRASTMEDALNKLHDAIHYPHQENLDVELDILPEETTTEQAI